MAQDYSPLEILVVDDLSTDNTLTVAAGFSDPRLRIERNERNLGLVGNWNQCIRAARGAFVKFLFQDDLLHPQCVSRMAQVMASPRVGMAFSRRKILLEDPADVEGRKWSETYGILDSKFENLGEQNEGRQLFEQYFRWGFRENLVGEPTSVMVRRSAFERIGLFNERMHQGPDFEMWIRLMFHYDVGFLPDPLSTFRYHGASTTSTNHLFNRPWLDMLWLIEGLLADPEIRSKHPEISSLCYVEGARVIKRQWERVRSGAPLPLRYQARSLLEYWRYRAQRLLGRQPRLHGAIHLQPP
jgi:glycosyltransferase involved in cell wall biosynthesis